MNSIIFIFSDYFIFIALHISILALIVYAILREIKMKQDMAGVKRSEKSWNYFYFANGILSLVITQTNNINFRNWKRI